MKPVLFSVSYAGLWGQARLGLPEFLEKAAQLGFPAVELMAKRPHLSVLDTTDEDAARLADRARALDIEISTIAAYTDFTASPAAAEVPFGEMQVAYVRRLARLGRVLGAKIIRVFTGYMTDEHSYKADWDKCVAAVRDCADAAGDEGLIVGVQNHHDVAVGPQAYLEFLADVARPNCKAMFDPWAPALQGEDLYTWAKAAAPHMAQTTLADYVRLRRYAYQPELVNYREVPAMVRAVPVGDGFIDFDAFFRGLKEGGFDGYVAYEMCSPLRGGGSIDNLDGTAKKSLEAIKSLI